MTEPIRLEDTGPIPGDPGFVPPEPAPDWDGTIAPPPPLRALAGGPDVITPDQTLAAGALTTTPLGLPYPAPTDLMADCWQHIKNLSDAVVNLLKSPGQTWAAYVGTANGNGDLVLPYGTLATINTYFFQCGYRGGTNGSTYIYLAVIGGSSWPGPGQGTTWCRMYGSLGGAALPNYIVECSLTGTGNPA